MRLDGHKFSSYTKTFKRPFDERSTHIFFACAYILVSSVMSSVATDLLQYFNASAAYTCSDEITLIFPYYPPTETETVPELPFGGKIQKLCSLGAGYASALFLKYMGKQTFDEDKEAKVNLKF
jgi:tRNA(His) guanylyltransferase